MARFWKGDFPDYLVQFKLTLPNSAPRFNGGIKATREMWRLESSGLNNLEKPFLAGY
jgi:hypothetical protein